jgi:hypothetical protein
MQIGSSANSTQMDLPKVNKLTDRVFNKLDPSNTGSFNKASFEKMFNQVSGGNSASTAIADKIFSKLDVSGNGEIDKSEFANEVNSFMDKIKHSGGLQSILGGGAAGGLQSLMGTSTSSSDSSTSRSSSNNPIDLFMKAIDSNNQESSTIQSTQDYLNNLQNQVG